MFGLGFGSACAVYVLVGFAVLVCYFSDFAGCGALCYGVAVVVCFCLVGLWLCWCLNSC